MLKRMITPMLVVMLLASCTGRNTENNDHHSAVMRKLFSFNTTKAFSVTIPETAAEAELRGFVTLDSLEYATGEYVHGAEQGSVYLHYRHIVPVQDASDGPVFTFVAPFAVSNQGSGIFWYLGLFSLNNESAVMQHRDSIFLGDRIVVDTMEITGDVIDLRYYTHDEGKAMYEEPLLLKQRKITVTSTRLK